MKRFVLPYIFLCLLCLEGKAQVNVWPKPATAAMVYTINNVSDNVTLSSAAGVMKIHSSYVDSIRSAYRTVIPSYFSSNRYGSISGALNAVGAQSYKSGTVLVPGGLNIITSTQYIKNPVFLRGGGSFSPKDAEWYNTGAMLKFKGLTIGVVDSTQGTRIEGLSFIGDSVNVTKILLQKKRPQRQQTTLGYQGVEWNLFRNADSIGVEIVAPDNNTYFAHNRVDYNNGHGLVLRVTDPGYTPRGLNPMIAFNRFIGNDSCQVKVDGIQYAGIIGNGILGPQNNRPMLFFDGISNRMTIANLVLLNDIEQEAGGILNAAAIKFNNGDLNGVMFNRIGQGQRGIEIAGSGSRTLLVMHNNFTGIDTAIYLKEGRLNLLSMNNRFSKDPTSYFKPHRGVVKKSGGTLRYLDISSTDEGTTIDAGGNASNAGLKLNPFAQANVSLFDSCASGVSRELEIWYHQAGKGRYRTKLFYQDGSFKIVPDSGFVRLSGEAIEIACVDTNIQRNSANSYIYGSSQRTGSSYPFNVSGHLIIQPRTSSSRDILFYTGSTTPSNRVVITRDGSVGIGGFDGRADSLGSGQGVIGLRNAAVNPTGVVRDGVILYAKDVNGSSELVVKDESGTETVLSNLTSSGEANTASNAAGTGVGIFKQKSGVNLVFKRLKASNGISITDATDSVLVAEKPRDWFWTKHGSLSASDNYNIWYTSQAITITRVTSYTDAGTYSFNLYWRSEASPNSGGTAILSSTLVADTNAEATTSFSSATVPANSWIALQSTAYASATKVGINITYKVD